MFHAGMGGQDRVVRFHYRRRYLQIEKHKKNKIRLDRKGDKFSNSGGRKNKITSLFLFLNFFRYHILVVSISFLSLFFLSFSVSLFNSFSSFLLSFILSFSLSVLQRKYFWNSGEKLSTLCLYTTAYSTCNCPSLLEMPSS